MKVLKICINEWVNTSRDKRELSVCRELGAEVLVMAKGDPGDHFREDTVEGFDVLRFSTRPLGTHVPNALNRLACLFTWSRAARRIPANVISGHDFIALLIGWLSTCFVPRNQKPILIYDSHEFELGRNTKRNRFQIWCVKQLEGFLIRRCAFSIFANDVAAKDVQSIYHLPECPVVARSTPDFWVLNPDAIAQCREELCAQLHVPTDTFLVMYHGGLMPGRGIELIIEEVAQNSKIACIILGNSLTPSYLETLKTLTEKKGGGERILFHPAVPHAELCNFVAAADLGLVTIPAVSKSYYYMLPNKFFENIQSLTPIICSDFPSIAGITEQYKIGLTCDPEKPEEIHACIERMRTDKTFYNTCKHNLVSAKADLCWEKEKEALKAAYRALL